MLLCREVCLFLLGEINFAKYVALSWSLFVCFLFFCTHATGRISRPIDMKFEHNMYLINISRPIVFGRNRTKDGAVTAIFRMFALRSSSVAVLWRILLKFGMQIDLVKGYLESAIRFSLRPTVLELFVIFRWLLFYWLISRAIAPASFDGSFWNSVCA